MAIGPLTVPVCFLPLLVVVVAHRVVDVSEPVGPSSTLTLSVTLPDDCKFTAERPSLWQIVDTQVPVQAEHGEAGCAQGCG